MALIKLLKPVEGTFRVVASRWLLYMLAVLPGMLSLQQHLNETIGKRPWFQDLQPPLDLVSTRFVLAQLGDGVALLLAGAGVIWLLQLVWLGGSARVLNPRTPGVYKKVFENGWRYLARFLRIAMIAVVVTAILQFAISKLFGALSARAETEAWPVYTSYITLNMWRAGVVFVTLTVVGVIAFWMRMIAVDEERYDTRRLPWQALKLVGRRPVAALLGQFLIVCVVLGIQAVALMCWRQSPNGIAWLGAWVVLQLVTAYVWQFRIRTALAILQQAR